MTSVSSESRPADLSGRGHVHGPLLVTAIGEASGSRAAAAALACEAAEADVGALLIDIGGPPPRPTLLAADAACELEERVAAGLKPAAVAARGKFCQLALPADGQGIDAAARAAELAGEYPSIIHFPYALLGSVILAARQSLAPSAVLLRADLAADRSVVARCVRWLRASGLEVAVLKKRLDWVAERRALFGAQNLQPEHGLPARLTRRLLRSAEAGDPAPAGGAPAGAEPPIVTVRGGVAETVQGDVLVIDFDTTTLADPEAIAIDLDSMREMREQAVQAAAPAWLLEEIDEAIEELRRRGSGCPGTGGGSR